MIASNQPNQPKYCQYCGVQIDATSKFCAFCGNKQDISNNTATIPITPLENGKCLVCGETFDREETRFCPSCGSEVKTTINVPVAPAVEVPMSGREPITTQAVPASFAPPMQPVQPATPVTVAAPVPATVGVSSQKTGAYIIPRPGRIIPHHPVNRVTAGVLAIVLGSVGAHDFYMGRVAAGVCSLIFCWTGIPALIGLIQGIVYLTSSNEHFRTKYLGF